MLERIKEHRARLLIVTSIALLVYTLLFGAYFEGLRSPDQMDYAQIARHIKRGRGFVLQSLKPLWLARINEFPLKEYPNFYRPPLYPLLVAGSFFIFGVKDGAVTLVSGLFYILSAGLIYLFAYEIISNRRLATVTAVVYIFLPSFLNYSMTGLTETTFTFLFILSLYLIYRKSPPLICGTVFGLAYLTRYNILFFLPGYLFLIYYLYKQRWISFLVKFTLSALVISSPWLVRNWILSGNPLFSWQKYEIMMFNDVNPGYDLYREFTQPSLLIFIIRHFTALIKKILKGVGGFYNDLPTLTNPFLMLFFGMYFFLQKPKRKIRLLAWGTVLMVLSQILILSVIHSLTRLFVPFIPVFLILAILTLDRISKELDLKPLGNNLIFYGMIILIIVPSIGQGFLFRSYSEPEWVHHQDLNFIQKNTEQNATIITDTPWAVSYYSKRISIWYPKTKHDLEKMIKGISAEKIYVYLSIRDKDRSNREASYFYSKNERFKLVKQFQNGRKLLTLKG